MTTLNPGLFPPLNSGLSLPISTYSLLNPSISSPFTFTKSWHIKDHNWALYKSLFPGETLMPALHRAGEETMEWRTDEEWVEGRWEMEGCMEMKHGQEVRRRKTFWGVWDYTAKSFRGATEHVCSRCVYPCGKLITSVSSCVCLCVGGWVDTVRAIRFLVHRSLEKITRSTN